MEAERGTECDVLTKYSLECFKDVGGDRLGLLLLLPEIIVML